jgi:hypothetical protein
MGFRSCAWNEGRAARVPMQLKREENALNRQVKLKT